MAPAKRHSTAKPLNAYRMSATLKNLYYRLTPTPSSLAVPTTSNSKEFRKAPRTNDLFAQTDPAVDGDECLRDCESCVVKYPRKFDIDETEELYGHVKGWSTHLVVATGKNDWVRDVADEKGSIMEAVEKGSVQPSNGRLMLSASDMPIPDHSDHSTRVLVLPAWQFIDNVTYANTPELITTFVNNGPTNTTPLPQSSPSQPSTSPLSTDPSSTQQLPLPPTSIPTTLSSSSSSLKANPCPHKYLILLCSQKTRDARCGQSAPLLRKEFERHLRPLGLYRDLHDERPGGVGIYFISHVGGHKFSANVMIYRHSSTVEPPALKDQDGIEQGIKQVLQNGRVEDDKGREVVLDVNQAQRDEGNGSAAQCIWLARVRPEDCENIVRYTVLAGKVLKPERQLRGGFDRGKQLVSW